MCVRVCTCVCAVCVSMCVCGVPITVKVYTFAVLCMEEVPTGISINITECEIWLSPFACM